MTSITRIRIGARIAATGFLGIVWVAVALSSQADDAFHMIWSLAFSADGNYLVCGGRDGTVSLWEIDDDGVATGIGTLQGHYIWVTAVAFAPDRPWLATGDLEGRIIVWDLEQGSIIRTFDVPQTRTLAFSPDGALLVAGTASGVRAWRLSDGSRLRDVCQYTYCAGGGTGGDAWSLAFLPEDRGLLAAAFDSCLEKWTFDSRQAVVDIALEERWICGGDLMCVGVAVCPTGTHVAVGSMRSRWSESDVAAGVSLYELSETGLGNPVWLIGHQRPDSLAFSPSGRFLLIGGWTEAVVHVWDVEQGQLLATYRDEGIQSGVYCTGAISPCERYVAVTSTEGPGRVNIIRLSDGQIVSFTDHGSKLPPALPFIHVDRETAERLEASAYEDWRWGRNESAIEAFGEAAAIYRRAGDTAGEANCLRNIGTCWYQVEEYQSASNAYGDALALFVALEDKGNVEFCAYWLLDSCLDIPNDHLFATYADAISDRVEALERAVERLRLAGERRLEAQAWNWLGLEHDMAGRAADAVRSYQEAARLFDEIGEVDLAASALVSGCSCVDDSTERIRCLEDVLEECHARDAASAEADALKGLGLACSAAGRHTEAIGWYQFAAEAYRDLGDLEGEARAWQYAGMMLKSLDRFEEAIGYLITASVLYADTRDGTQVVEFEAWTLMDLGDCHLALMEYAEATSAYEKALAVGRSGCGTINLTARPLWGMGRCHWAMNALELAREAYEAAIAETEAYVAREEREAFRQHLQNASFRRLYEEYIELLFAIGDTAAMLPASERCRARTFLDLLVNGPQGWPEEITEAGVVSQAVDTEALLLDVEEAVAGLPAGTAVLECFVTETATYSWVVTNTGAGEPIRMEIARADLREQVLAFRTVLETPTTGLMDLPNEGTLAMSRDLYDLLVAPVEDQLDGIEHLVIVPSGPLYYLPFAALLDCPDCTGPELWGGTYLVERCSVSYAPSLTTLKYAWASADRAHGDPLFLALADPDSGDAGIPRLPEAQREAERAAELFDPSEVYVDVGATEEVLRARASSADQLLLSTHGVFNPLSPMFSYLLFSPSEGSDGRLYTHEIFGLDLQSDLVVLSACETLLPALEEAREQVRAVRGMGEEEDVELTEELLETLTAGDEIVGLTRAFLYAGTPSVLSSLWRVVSETTEPLMVAFYGYLQQGFNKAQALRQAQLDVKTSYPHPRYWAAFSLVGDWTGSAGSEREPPDTGKLDYELYQLLAAWKESERSPEERAPIVSVLIEFVSAVTEEDLDGLVAPCEDVQVEGAFGRLVQLAIPLSHLEGVMELPRVRTIVLAPKAYLEGT